MLLLKRKNQWLVALASLRGRRLYEPEGQPMFHRQDADATILIRKPAPQNFVACSKQAPALVSG
jgi:hypothetical protein